MIIPKPEHSVFKKFKHAVVDFVTGKHSKQLENLASAYTKEFIPRLFRLVLGEHEVLDVAESVDQVDMLLHGLRKSYFEDMQCWEDENQFKTEVYFGFNLGSIDSGVGQKCCFLFFFVLHFNVVKQNI